MATSTATASKPKSTRDDLPGVSLIDADVHSYPASIQAFMPYLSQRWRAYVTTSGFEGPGIIGAGYPRLYKAAGRRDAWPPSGGNPGTDEPFARAQLLDTWGIEYAILNPLYGVAAIHNLDLGNAIMRALNEWTAADWLDADPRWKGSIIVNTADPSAAADEIRRAGADPRFVQVLLLVRSEAPYGRRQYDPIFAAAADLGLPLGLHFGGQHGPITPSGWPSYYIEDHTGMTMAFQAQVISLVCEGVFEKYRDLKVALIEGGFAWLPPLMWRLDKNYRGLREEVPWLTELPSAYIRKHFRATTQPMEEPDNPRQLLQIMEMLGEADFLMFATDYPHWDFDAPDRALPGVVPAELRAKIMATNALEFYDFARA